MPTDLKDTQKRRRLADELDRLRLVLTGKGAEESDGQAGQLLAIFRLCPGLTLESWGELSESHGFGDWVPLPLSGDLFPQLQGLSQTIDQLSHQSRHDPLTGLANRRAFESSLDMETERSERNTSPMTLILLDIDNFKIINDTYGHSCGDLVLCELSRSLLASKRRYDVAARVGGEEFALILSGLGLFRARRVAERIMDEIRQIVVSCGENEISFTVSMGICCYKGLVPVTPQKLYDLADKALYQAKEKGKDRIEAADIPDLAEPPRTATVVQADEKRFLFTGEGKGEES